MLRRLTLGFAGVVTAADVTQNAVNIYTPNPKTTAGPQYQIGGGSTSLAGPQYLTFDSASNLWVTNWLSSVTSGEVLEFKAEATGNVIPYQTFSTGNVRPRGIADVLYTFSGTTTTADVLAVAVVDPSQSAGFNSGVQFFTAGRVGRSLFASVGDARAHTDRYADSLAYAVADAVQFDTDPDSNDGGDRDAAQHRADRDDFGKRERHPSADGTCAGYERQNLRRRSSLDGVHAELPGYSDLPGGFERCGDAPVDLRDEHRANGADRREGR